MKEYLDNDVADLYSSFSLSLNDLIQLTKEVHQAAMQRTTEEMAFHLNSPYMFVIVGEVKAGKSSFVNALLKSKTDICAVAVSPKTDTIQQITYGEEYREESLSPFLKRIYHPEDILKQISIVDTPGTNTIIDHHQEITEKFIPHADLIVFVFEAKNPYRQSAWEFFDYINIDWHKNIIFILQQKDLLGIEDLNINIKGVEKQAIKKGVSHPKVFSVSAKQEQEGLEDSGFDPLRAFIDERIIKGNTALLKLENNILTASNINTKIGDSIKLREEQFQLDRVFREEIKTTLEEQEIKTHRQVDILTENLVASYDGITSQKVEDLSKGLSILAVLKRTFSSVFGGDKGLKVWLQDQAKDFELKLNKTLKTKLQDGILDVSEDIQMMGKMVNAKIKTSQTVLNNSDEIFADIAEKRAHVLGDLQKSFKDFLNNADNFYDPESLSATESMAPNIAAGGGMAVIGVILSTAVNGLVFDITGGILTTIGVLFASVSVGWNRSRLLKKFKQEIIEGRIRIETEVSSTLKNYAQRIKNRIDQNFYRLDTMLKDEAKEIEQLNSLNSTIKINLEVIRERIANS